MSIRKQLCGIILSLAWFTVSPQPAQAQSEQEITRTTFYTDLERGASWSALSNRIYSFTPPHPDQSSCVFIANSNPTSSHTFSVSVFQTGDSQVSTYLGNTGRFVTDTVVGTPSPVAASSMTSFYVHSNAAAKLAIQFTGGATAAGSPDTADLFVVFTNALSCGPVQTGGSSGTNLIPNTTAQLQSAPINFTATGNNTIVTGVASQRVRIYQIFFTVNAATNVTAQDGAATTLTGAMSFTANGSLTFFNNTEPYFTTTAGNAFVLNQSGTAQISGRVYYTQQ